MIPEAWLPVPVLSSGFFARKAASSSCALKSGVSVLDGDDMVGEAYVFSVMGDIFAFVDGKIKYFQGRYFGQYRRERYIRIQMFIL